MIVFGLQSLKNLKIHFKSRPKLAVRGMDDKN
jgi:hypothetical protein